MIRVWDDLEGVYLAGEYGLQQCLGSDRDAAFYQTTFGPDQRRAVLKLTPEDASTGEEQLARWRAAFELSHPNLLALLDCGRAAAGGDSYLYAVFEYPDDSLAKALAGGLLSEEETREVLTAVLAALRYLHDQDMVHAAVDADHVVAVGDRIKLASDTVRRAGSTATPAEDVRALGALLVQLRTGRRPETGADADLSGISDPLATIIRHALEPDDGRRWTAAEIDAALNPPAAVPVETKAEIRVPPEAPARSTSRDIPPRVLGLPKRSPALPLLIAAVGAVLVAVLLAITQRSAPDAPSTAIAPPAAAQPAPAPPTPAPPVPTQEARPVVQRAATPPQPHEGWRVIAYTYNHREHAEHKVRTINRLLPGFHAAVFAPRGSEQPPFFVALGGRMSREDAIALQKRARSRGLPRDTFVRKFSN